MSVALSPAGDLVALSVGTRLSISAIAGSQVVSLLQTDCALTPGLTWSPGGDKLAFRDDDGEGRVLHLAGAASVAQAESQLTALGMTNAIAFAPDGDRLAKLTSSLPGRMTLSLVEPGREVCWERILPRNRMSASSEGTGLAWSRDGRRLACSTGTQTVWVIDAVTGEPVWQFDGHEQMVTGLDWIDDQSLLSASLDATLQVWRPDDSAPTQVVETIAAEGMVFVRDQNIALIWSVNGELLAWSLTETPTQLWYRDAPSWSVAAHFTQLAVSAANDRLALIDAGTTELVLVSGWDRAVSAPAATTTYANAKVLLLGDSGVGKSGLAMVLAGERFQATESTHGRRIWLLPAAEEPGSADDHREVLLWDLAGQPGYRIVHQLHLDGAALALILFDSKSEIDPLAGVRHWARAVRHAHLAMGDGLTTFLVAARADRGGITVSSRRIQQVMTDFGLDEYFQTSAKEGRDTSLLRSRLLQAIDWERLPKITSTTLFAAVKQFVVQHKAAGRLLTPVEELCRMFLADVPGGQELLATEETPPGSSAAGPREASPVRLASVFEGCIARLESAGLVKRLKFGDYVLLQPELLDAFASAIVNAAREEPDELGSILESKVVNLEFALPATDLMLEQHQQRLLVLATLTELLEHELALRESAKDGFQLIFPSAYRRDLPPSEVPRGDGVVFQFEGPVLNIYATLIVRLARSNVFRRTATWQSAARFAADPGECTVYLKHDSEGKAELWVGYDRVPDLLRKRFERFVQHHLDLRAIPDSVTRERQYGCPNDGTAFTSEQVREVIRRRGRTSIRCPVCEEKVMLRDDYDASGSDQSTAAMDASADAGREQAAATAVLRGRAAVGEFDIFLSYHWEDRAAARNLARQLQEHGLRTWLDERELRPGSPWQPDLGDVIESVPAAVVVLGSEVGRWQKQEIDALYRQHVERGCTVVPVLLTGRKPPGVPVFLDGLTWVNLTQTDPDPIDRLMYGITGERPDR